MSSKTVTRLEEKADIVYEASKFGLVFIIAMSGLIGLWGVACLLGGLFTNGIGGLLRGYLTAITGF